MLTNIQNEYEVDDFNSRTLVLPLKENEFSAGEEEIKYLREVSLHNASQSAAADCWDFLFPSALENKFSAGWE
ncbi:MAG: hypothetical protein A3D31_15105 [Candidatus Fluviicola riflensis]|nr:MAG: hypothetical protein CHH17_00040 [Candidatus Fluviicola riflensis]OGS78291.1 MAG: hypothetical protein A3D31_15105 [Candidatus Fluviicola riflensis]OGS85357.1 MAG: hypothetical protein A2724_12040 [Fluviicola sp. RIFCSPHIGHO2_01_FULL_43_53]OGS87399.1 MAG: hypothetical protein A3E30_08460 [Fluviicola sp. RIFCSPHIGHO2_12_FULL_43_24]